MGNPKNEKKSKKNKKNSKINLAPFNWYRTMSKKQEPAVHPTAVHPENMSSKYSSSNLLFECIGPFLMLTCSMWVLLGIFSANLFGLCTLDGQRDQYLLHACVLILELHKRMLLSNGEQHEWPKSWLSGFVCPGYM